jgi:nitronate monooxygenase
MSSATTVAEARWLEVRGCDAIIAQGWEAGGHRGIFLTTDLSTQLGTFALLPRIVDAVNVPVIAAGGIADSRGVAAAFALGASAVQVGTAYLSCPEATITDAHRAALRSDEETVVTNVYTGRPARSIVNPFVRDVGPISELAPEFPLATAALAPLRGKDPQVGPFWSGQHRIVRALSAAELTRQLGAR